jgi:hypothetical protein
MWGDPYGPEWEWLGRETRDFENAVRRGASFPVYEVREPRVSGGALADCEWSGELEAVGLSWGEPLSRSGPMLYAWTARVPPDDEVGPDEPELDEVLADERDRLYDHVGIDEPPPQTTEEATVRSPSDRSLELWGTGRVPG